MRTGKKIARRVDPYVNALDRALRVPTIQFSKCLHQQFTTFTQCHWAAYHATRNLVLRLLYATML